MPMDADRFIKRLHGLGKTMPAQQVSIAQKALSRRALEGLTQETPVKTGRARGNWNVGMGQPDTSTSESVDKDGSATVARGDKVISQGAGLGQSIFVTNSLAYIKQLDDGHSQQAPAGMVDVTLKRLKAQL